MSDLINIDEIMQELRNNAKDKNYLREAVVFDIVCAREEEAEDFDFSGELMERDVRYMDRSYYVDYDQPIAGRSPRIRKFIESLHQPHFKPSWDAQNRFNLKAASATS